MILVDSSVWIDYFRGNQTPETDRLDQLLGQELIAIGDLILIEILRGFDSPQDYRQAKKLLLTLELVDLGGRDVALLAVEHFRKLRSLGITVRKTIDTIIATRCILDDLPLLFSDRDFEPFVNHLGLQKA